MLNSLDLSNEKFNNVESYATELGSALKPNCNVIINGEPIVSKLEFQKKWLMTPLTFHQITNFDCHLIPGLNSYVININGKVKFDESGRNRLGESGDLIVSQQPKKNMSSWFGFFLSLVIDQPGMNKEIVDNFDYRINYKPHDTIISI